VTRHQCWLDNGFIDYESCDDTLQNVSDESDGLKTMVHNMPRRRFGRTELQMPVFSCGGMRYQYKWQDVEPSEVPTENQENLEATIHRSLELGINHIETARGYGSSEMQLGWVLPKLDRSKIILQTKIAPMDAAKFRETFEKSMAYLKVDHVDLFAFHGVNTGELLDQVLEPGGCLSVVREYQKQGRIRSVGLSTHAPCDVITRACATGEFDYVNLHWYWINQFNWEAVREATRQDMGVFIISPSDKGGRLYDPPQRLVDLCAPLTPMAFNNLFCLSHPEIHTLSIGASRPTDFDAHVASLPHYDNAAQAIAPVLDNLNARLTAFHGSDWMSKWQDGIPKDWEALPGGVHVVEILRLFTFGAPLDLTEWAKSRYNLFGHANHWFPGNSAADIDAAAIREACAASPFADRLPQLLNTIHSMYGGIAQKRLSES
jgi:predicted aldo/keto reductase-like oxidoreductase